LTVGVNVSGAQYSWMPFVSASDLDYLQSEGISLIRLPISWERMQPTLNGPLDPAYLAGLENVLNEAAARGIKVIVDVSNGGGYDANYAAQAAAEGGVITQADLATSSKIGTSAVPISSFASLWSQLATQLTGHAGLAGYDLMNEPNSMPDATVWPKAAQAAVDAIRAIDMNTPIYVEGDQYASAKWWVAYNANLHITDPANKIIYEAHQYFDNGSGTYTQTYAQSGDTPTTGVQDVQPFLDWLKANNYQGYLGEIGIPDNDPNWVLVLNNALSALEASGVSSTVWNYLYSDPSGNNSWWPVSPVDSIDPQKGWGAAIMEAIFSHTSPTIAGNHLTVDGKAYHVTLTGTGAANSTVQVADGSIQIGTATVDAQGNWSFVTGILTNSPHSFTATDKDAAGTVSQVSAALNLDVTATVIESSGSTSLIELGNNFYFSGNSTGSGPELKTGGVAVVAGQIGAWAPIGVEQTASGYEVAWKVAGADQYGVWYTDSSGNFISNTAVVSGTSSTLESFETSFHQDLNGDGVIGPPSLPASVIESAGLTSLVEVSNNFYLNSNSTGSGPELKSGGAAVVAGQLGAWAPIGAEQTATGYEIAWKVAGVDEYGVWYTDSSGNFISNTAVVSGTSSTLEWFETSFHQDLNGDGVIGPPSLPASVIESSGPTSLVEVSNNFFLDSNSTGSGPELKSGGTAVTAGQLGAWTPIAVEQTATGYDVAWKVAGADQYGVWYTDSSGNFISNTAVVSGTSAMLESFESVFHHDLNGDGIINTPTTVIEATGNVLLTLSQVTQAATIDAGSSLELTGADSGTVKFSGTTGTLVLDQSSLFTGKILNLTGDGNPSSSDQIDLKDISFGAGTTYSYAGDVSGGILTVRDAQNHTANLSLVGNYTNSTFTLSSDGHGGTIAIDPPKDGFHFVSAAAVTGGSTAPAVTIGGAANDAFVFHAPPGGASATPDSLALDRPGSKAESSHPVTLVTDTQPDHQWTDAGHDAGANFANAHFPGLHDFIIH